MTRAAIAGRNGCVVELGAGTGEVTRALLEAGIRPHRLALIERDPELAATFSQSGDGFYTLARRVVAQWHPADSTPDPALVEDQAIAILAFINGVMMTFVARQPPVDTAEHLDRLIQGVIARVADVRRE